MTTLKTSAWLAFGAVAFLSNASYMAAQSISASTSPATVSSLASNATTTGRPPKPPQVTCAAGDLTIVADGSTLGSIFTAIDSCLGLKIILPEGQEAARTYLALGPGPARVILESLLASSDYDYVLRASASHPDKIESVLLMARNADSSEAKATSVPEGLVMTPARSAWAENLRANKHSGGAGEEDTPLAPEASKPFEKTESEEPGKQQGSEASSDKPSAAPSISSADSSPKLNDPAAPLEKSAGTSNDDPAPDDASATPALSKEVQTKINSMEQLFEQRKQMTAGQSPAPKPQ